MAGTHTRLPRMKDGDRPTLLRKSFVSQLIAEVNGATKHPHGWFLVFPRAAMLQRKNTNEIIALAWRSDDLSTNVQYYDSINI